MQPTPQLWSDINMILILCFVSYVLTFYLSGAKNEKPQAELNPKCCIFGRVISQKPVDHFRREQCTFSQLQLPFILHGIQEAFLQFLSRLVRVQTNNRNTFCTEKQKLQRQIPILQIVPDLLCPACIDGTVESNFPQSGYTDTFL